VLSLFVRSYSDAGLLAGQPTIDLSHLRTLNITSPKLLRELLESAGRLQPALEELQIVLNDHDDMVEYRSFLFANPTIRQLCLNTKGMGMEIYSCHELLHFLPPTIEVLTIRNLDTLWLQTLSRAHDDRVGVGGETTQICPNLRHLIITNPLSVCFSELIEFVHARCLPKDNSRFTRAGYLALESFVLREVEQSSLLEELKSCEEWRNATIRSNHYEEEYELRWYFDGG
jgi:hypothetical protein